MLQGTGRPVTTSLGDPGSPEGNGWADGVRVGLGLAVPVVLAEVLGEAGVVGAVGAGFELVHAVIMAPQRTATVQNRATMPASLPALCAKSVDRLPTVVSNGS
jgi:hypothetical protein